MRITEEHVYRYLNGECWVLAVELAKITKWKIAATSTHAFVISPDGQFVVDIRGLQPLHLLSVEFCDNWEGQHEIYGGHVKAKNRFIQEKWSLDTEDVDWGEAKRIARHLAKKISASACTTENES